MMHPLSHVDNYNFNPSTDGTKQRFIESNIVWVLHVWPLVLVNYKLVVLNWSRLNVCTIHVFKV